MTVIAALSRRIRTRNVRRQARRGITYIRGRYGDGHEQQRQRALAAWEKYRP